MRLLFVGINPGMRSAALRQHFAGPGNRFWPALHAGGLTAQLLRPDRQHELSAMGIGITNLVRRPTARAAELTTTELRAGAAALLSAVAAWRPAVVAVLGVTAYRTAFAQPRAKVGLQPHGQPSAGARWFVLHNPSGLNAHAQPADHARWFAHVGRTAGLSLT